MLSSTGIVSIWVRLCGRGDSGALESGPCFWYALREGLTVRTTSGLSLAEIAIFEKAFQEES